MTGCTCKKKKVYRIRQLVTSLQVAQSCPWQTDEPDAKQVLLGVVIVGSLAWSWCWCLSVGLVYRSVPTDLTVKPEAERAMIHRLMGLRAKGLIVLVSPN